MALKMTITEVPALQDSSPRWKIKFLETAEKELEKLDKASSRIISRYIRERLETSEDPRRFGKPLAGNLKEFWCYRVGDYRIICNIDNEKILILVVRIAHRREVYD